MMQRAARCELGGSFVCGDRGLWRSSQIGWSSPTFISHIWPSHVGSIGEA